MDSVIRVLLERADARRQSLLGLADAIPEDFWVRRAAGEDWTAAHHLAHALSSDAVVAEVAPAFSRANLEDLAARRQAALETALELPRPELLRQAAETRAALRRVFASLDAAALESAMTVSDNRNAWGERAVVTLFAYLHSWADHDPEHELAIRQAVATPPDLSAIVHVRRLR